MTSPDELPLGTIFFPIVLVVLLENADSGARCAGARNTLCSEKAVLLQQITRQVSSFGISFLIVI